MTPTEGAALLNGREYRKEMTREEEALFRASGLVAVFGASDDLTEFRGAIDDEIGAYGGTTALIDAKGLLPDRDSIEDDDELESFFARKRNALTLEALWGVEPDYSWTFKTGIPHATFDIVEDGDPYCRGLVFALASAGEAGAAETVKLGSVHEHAVANGETPNDHPSNPQGRR